MASCLVTGVAGFIGSHLAERLLADGHQVVGIDCFTDYYPRSLKEKNLEMLHQNQRFRLVEADLNDVDHADLLEGVEFVFHQAAQAGVRTSWGANFSIYTANNIEATQKLLEAAKSSPLRKFIFASSSSVYGDTPDLPMRETSPLHPLSPYGVTKMAAEKLCDLYGKNYGVPVVSLRYFTVYGPRQRPDMAFHRFIRAQLEGDELVVYGDGTQTRDFTFVDDAVEANLLAMEIERDGLIFNIGGGSQVSIRSVIEILGHLTGSPTRVRYEEKQRGDVHDTLADVSMARQMLGYRPTVAFEDGLEKEIDWTRTLYLT
jgi:nucleoside-diphosphate-sugar epimerase